MRLSEHCRRWLVLALGVGLTAFTLSACKKDHHSTASGGGVGSQSVVTVKGANS